MTPIKIATWAVRRRTAWPVALLATALLAASCGGGGRGFDVGLARQGVDLAYSDESKAPPEPAAVIPRAPVYTSGAVAAIEPPLTVKKPEPAVLPKLPKLNACPEAPADARPQQSASVFVTKPPPAGRYTAHNTGTIVLQGALAAKVKYPEHTLYTIENVTMNHVDDPIEGPIDTFTYDVVSLGLDGSIVRTTYQGTYKQASVEGQVFENAGQGRGPTSDIVLLKQEVKQGAKDEVFQPTPAVTVFSYRSGVGTTWTSAGVDTASGTAMAVQGSVVATQPVDVCGTVVDTYVIQTTERIANVATGYTYETDPQNPNQYFVATQLGGVIVREDVHTTTTVGGTSPQVVVLNYTTVLDAPGPTLAQ